MKIPPEPCDTDECLVRAACQLKNSYPWDRIHKCEMYQKHREKELRIMKINGFFSSIYEFCIGITAITVFFGIPAFFMVLGVWKAYELAKPLIMEILS
jgi:hypothetical protein